MMKIVVMLIIASIMFASEGTERGIDREKRIACQIAKENAKEKFNVVDIQPSCSCEITDGRDWICFIRFTYEAEKSD